MTQFAKSSFLFHVPGTLFSKEIRLADMNGDGKQDLIVAEMTGDRGSTAVRIYAGDGAGGFTDATPTIYTGGAAQTQLARELILADFNGDGRLDAYVADHGYEQEAPILGFQNALILSSGVHQLTNATAANLPAVSDFTHSVEAADIDGDGDIDIYVGNTGLQDPYFLINNGVGVFSLSRSGLPSQILSSNPTGPVHFATEAFIDADNDGDLDLYLGVARGNNIAALLLNDGQGHFSINSLALPVPANMPVGTDAVDAQAADINGDGRMDLIVGYSLGLPPTVPRYTQILINQGGNVFADETEARLPAAIQQEPELNGFMYFTERVQFIDFNGDGYLDLFLSDGAGAVGLLPAGYYGLLGSAAPLYLNDGTGHFVHATKGLFDLEGQYGPFFIAHAGDVNGDGRMDVLGWNRRNQDEVVTVQLAQDPGVVMSGGEGADTLLGDSSAEVMSGLGGDDVIFAAQGNDILNGDDGADYLNGGAGNDTLDGGMGDDTLVGGDGNDGLNDLFGANSYDGGNGTDFASISLASSSSALTYTVGVNGIAGAPTVTFNSIEQVTIIGGSGADHFTGGALADTLDGGAGADVLVGGGGNDTYGVDSTADVVTELTNQGNDTVATTLINVSLASYANIENLTYTGSAAFIGVGDNNVNAITGGAGNDYFYTYEGDDTANGGVGVDVFILGAGNDTANGGDGQDYLFGGDGNDTLNGDGGVDVLLGGPGNDVMNGGAEGDYFYGEDGNDTGNGGDGNDIFVMTAGNDIAFGDAGQDYFYMGDGDDVMNGGAGVDVMLGEAGNDTFNSGLGVDYAFMGTGNDTLILDKTNSGVTVLYDFTAGDASGDVIRLTNSGLTTFAQVQAAISDFTASGGFCILTLDADTAVWLIGVAPSQLTTGDFAFA